MKEEYVDPLCKRLGKQLREIPYYPRGNVKHFAQTVKNWLTDPNCAGFCTQNAVCIGGIAPDPTNYASRVATEWAWLSNGLDGDRVFRAWENWAVEMGATHIVCSVNCFFRDDLSYEKLQRQTRIKEMMARREYYEFQSKYMRKLL